jgi:hypothetical protein
MTVRRDSAVVISDPDKEWLDSSSAYLSALGYKPRCLLDVESAIQGIPFDRQTLVVASHYCPVNS